MGRVNRKRGKGGDGEISKKAEATENQLAEAVEFELGIDWNDLGEVAKDYYRKYGVTPATLDKDKKPASSSTSSYKSSYSGGSKSSTTTTTWSKSCTHDREPVQLAENIVIWASANRDRKEKDKRPHVGLYFASSWDDFSSYSRTEYSDGWKGPKGNPGHKKKVDEEICVFDWPDMSTPNDSQHVIASLEYGLNKAGEGKAVEIGCIGGHGRTGTAMAAMLILLGEDDAGEACRWVWKNYCKHAIESQKQIDWLYALASFKYPATAVKKELAYKEELAKAKEEEERKKKAKQAPLVKTVDKRHSKVGNKILEGIDATLSAMMGMGGGPTKGSEDSSVPGMDTDAYEEWWLEKAATYFYNLYDQGFTNENALLEAAETYSVEIGTLAAYVAGQQKEVDARTDYEKANEAIAKENNGYL